MMTDRIIRVPECLKMTGLSETTLYRKEKAGEFPKRLKISKYSVGWKEGDVQKWIESLHDNAGGGNHAT